MCQSAAFAVRLLVVKGKARVWGAALVLVVISVAVSGLIRAVWRAPQPRQKQLEDLVTFALPLLTAACAVAGIVWKWGQKRVKPPQRQELDDLADGLAADVRAQWKQEATTRGLLDPITVRWGRPSLPLGGSAAAAAASRRFDPLPGLAAATEADLAAGGIGDLYVVYGGLRSGRLVIAGAPGAGKSGAAVQLILAVLSRREKEPQIPVPVLFTAQEWDPVSQPVQDWFVQQVQHTYPAFAGKGGAEKASELIKAGKVMVILDGLDEIAEELRPAALQALSQQATFRLVVLSRTAEMASAASHRGWLEGAAAIELQAIDPASAADYLEKVQLDPPPAGWRDLTEEVRRVPQSPLARALDSPLTLTLVRDTYREGDDVQELLKFCDTAQRGSSADSLTEKIVDHLLDRVFKAAYAPRPGEKTSSYDPGTAQDALAQIAARMNQDGTRDLQWWRIPEWAPPAPRFIVSGLVGVLIGVIIWLAGQPDAGFAVGLLGGLAGAGAGRGSNKPPHGIRRPRWRQVLSWEILIFGLVSGLVFGLVLGLISGFKSGAVVGLVFGFGTVLGSVLLMLVIQFADELVQAGSTSTPSPFVSRHNDRGYAIVCGVEFGLVFGISGFIVVFQDRVVFEFVGALGFAILAGLLAGLLASQGWPSSLAAAQLASRWHTPVRLMTFLEDARERSVLRTVGATYQFRHARLQDRLAAAAADKRNDGNATSQQADECTPASTDHEQ